MERGIEMEYYCFGIGKEVEIMKFLIEAGLENIVFQTMAKQFRIGYDDPQYIADFLGHKLTEKEWKRLKRGVKWIMTRAGLKISDEKIREIINKYNIEIEE